MCIFYEKINIQEKMKLNGEIELNVLEEKIRFLKLKIAEKQRQIHVTRKLLPVKSALDADLAVLQIQVGNVFITKFLGPFAFLFFSSFVCMSHKFFLVNQAMLLLVPRRTHDLNVRVQSVLQTSEL